jgi:thiamine kinase-like enzyme
MGDPFFDLGSFAANNEFSEDEEQRLLEAYFREPASPRRTAALKLLRFMSDLREAMWGVLQDVAPKLDFDFRGYAGMHFGRLTRSGDDPGFARLLEEARSPD